VTSLGRRHLGYVGSSKEKRIWVIREKEIKARRNSRKGPSLVRRTNEKGKKKRRTNKWPVLSGEASSGNEPAWATSRRIASGRPLLTTTIRLLQSKAVASLADSSIVAETSGECRHPQNRPSISLTACLKPAP